MTPKDLIHAIYRQLDENKVQMVARFASAMEAIRALRRLRERHWEAAFNLEAASRGGGTYYSYVVVRGYDPRAELRYAPEDDG